MIKSMRVRRFNVLVRFWKSDTRVSDDASRTVLGMAFAGLGEKDAAIAEANAPSRSF
jgi:hypothetical protein